MFRTKNSVIAVVFAFLSLLSVGAVLYGPGHSAPAQATEPKDSKLKDLLKERVATLREIARGTAQAHQSGEVSVDQVHEANLAVLNAELDLCESDKDRVAVLEKIVQLAKQQEEHAAQSAKAGIGSVNGPLKAKVRRLEAEIALERARAAVVAATAQEPQKPHQTAGTGIYGGFAGGIALIGQPDVQKELDLRDDQYPKVKQLLDDVRQQMGFPGVGFGIAPEVRLAYYEKRAEVNRPAEESLARILDDKQSKRLEELKLQARFRALAQPEVAKKLTLSQDQRDAIQKIFTEHKQAVRKLMEGYDPTKLSREEMAERRREIQALFEKAEADAFDILSDEQTTKWKQMVGEKFEFRNRNFRIAFESD